MNEVSRLMNIALELAVVMHVIALLLHLEYMFMFSMTKHEPFYEPN